MTINLKTLTISKAHDSLVKGEYSAVELADAYLSEIEKKNKDLNAYLEVFSDVREQAKEADKKLKNTPASELSNLVGIPLAIKDNILIEGRRVGAASKILEGYVASYDATAIKKLKEAGAVFLGRTNMDEFAMGSSTETSAYGITRNPHDMTRVPGGSSGGSATAVAANMALAALGSDTAGSVRQPASFCGVAGFKPTYGSVSRFGLMAMGSSLDVIGPIAKNTEDAQTVFECMMGRDSLDSTSIELPTTTDQPLTPRKIGVPRALLEGVDADVRSNFEQALGHYATMGCEIRDIEFSYVSYSLPAYYVIIPAEVSTNLARFDGVKFGLHKDGKNLLEDYLLTRREGFGREARRRILLGTYVLSAGYADAYYNKAVKVRRLIQNELHSTFSSGVDFIATPTSPVPAFKIGEKTTDPLQMYLMDIFTVIANMAGIPAISVPSGFVDRDGKKLPVGLQLMAAHGDDINLLEAGKRFERASVLPRG